MAPSASEIDKVILRCQRLLASLPRSDPHRPHLLLHLALQQNDRFRFSRQKGDLDKSITYLTEAVLLRSQLVDQAFHFLPVVLSSRGSIYKNPEDIKSSVKYFRFLRINSHLLEAINIEHCHYVQPMILALAHHSMLESSDVIQDIKEMAALIHGLLSSDVSTSGLICVIDAFYTAVARTFYLDDAKLPPEKVVQVLREVEMILPHSPGSHSEFDSNLPRIEKDILKCRRLLALTPRSHPYRPPLLRRLGVLQNDGVIQNFRHSPLSYKKDDLDGSIINFAEAILLSFRPSRVVVNIFFELATALFLRFLFCKQPEDIKSSIKFFRFLQINCHPLEAFNIGRCLFTELMIQVLAHHVRLESSDRILDIKEMAALTHELLSSNVSTSDLIRAIDTFYGAVAITFYLEDAKLPPEKVVQVLREVEMILPHSPGSHSEVDSNLPQIEKYILKCRRLLALTPRSHPYRPRLIWRLGLLQCQRSTRKDDLDGSINSITEAILLSFRPSRDVIYMFIELARVLADRSAFFRQPEDVKSSIKYFRFVRILFHPLEAFGILHARWLSEFVSALVLNVGCLELGSGDMTQYLEEIQEEIVTLITEVLASNEASTESWTAIQAFAVAITTSEMFRRKETQDISERAIRLLREATLLKPDSHNASFALASCLAERFRTTHVINDYEEAIANADKIIAVNFPGDGPITTQTNTIELILGLLESRLNSDWRPEYLEDAIYRIRTLLCIPNLPDHDLERLTGFRKTLEGARSSFGITGNSRESFYNGLASGLQPIIHQSVVMDGSDPRFPLDVERFDQLAKVHTAFLRGDMMDAEIEAGVEYSRRLLPVQRAYTQWPFLSAILFANILSHAYVRTNRKDYIDEAIITYRKLREAATPKDIRFKATVGLLHCLGICAEPNIYTRHHLEEGLLEECIHLLSEAANDGSAAPSCRFELSCKWAFIARIHNHPSTSTAYETSMSLMQETLTFSPTLQFQHFNLAGMPRHMLGISSDYASHQIGTGQVKQAIETLERGRALLWSEMRGLRTSAGQLELRAADSSLADKLANINQRLESVTVSVAQSDTQAIVDSGTETATGTGRREPEVMDSIGVLVTTQRRLVDERNSIISHIQSLPGFETFLKPSSFDVLNCAAARGPVIIINQSRLIAPFLSNAENQLVIPSHIIILLEDLPPSVISAPWNFHDRAYQLKSDLLHVRKRKGLDSDDYDLTLAKVLSDLYELVGKPVIEKLNQLEVPKGSRVWWCPTGDFCSLPLHAMGPIPSDDGNEVYFSDMYIPSYTPTLSALIESRKPGLASEASDNLKPSILLVAQPDTLPGAWGEIGVIQAAKTSVTTLVSAMATSRTVIEGLRDHRFAHFVCHGLLETGKPFDASLELHGDNLTLLEIVRSQLPAAELAFLSACHTAELTEDSVDDEGLHLAAAMQYCGFRSVVGTMWAMADTDGTDLSKHFYKAIFSEKAGQNGVPYHERSARALQVAVKKLRGKRGISLERRVNFVHYGA